MGKIVFWIVVFFVVLLAVRLVNAVAAKARREEQAKRESPPGREKLAAEPTVRCARCGVYLPKSEALPSPDGYRCGDPACTRQR